MRNYAYLVFRDIFQEYFAARCLALGRGVNLAEGLIKKYLHSSRWREVILLAAAAAPPDKADLILKSALETENPFEVYIHSNVMMAGWILADLPRVDPLKGKDVINTLISFTDSRNIDLLRIDALEVLTEIGRTSPPEDVSWGLELLRDEYSFVRELAVSYFTRVGKDDPEVRKEIFRLLRDEYSFVRELAVSYFTRVGKDDPEVRKEIFRLLRNESYSLSSGRKIQDIAVEFLSMYAREESFEKAPNLFITEDLPTRRGAYKLMKALIQTQEKS